MDINTAVRLAIDNVVEDGLSDVLEPVHELEFLKDAEFRDEITKLVTKSLSAHSFQGLNIESIGHTLAPKDVGLYGFRRVTVHAPGSSDGGGWPCQWASMACVTNV